jgi:hypothetical protein
MPLLLESPDGQQRLELAIVGYEFPDVEGEKHDSDWLRIRADVRIGDLAWSAEHPSLRTHEVNWLVDWLEALGSGCGKYLTRDFLAQSLTFRADPLPDGLTRLQVYFGTRMYPYPGRRHPPAWDEDNDVYVEIALTSQQLHAAARDLRAELSRYPARTPSPDYPSPTI